MELERQLARSLFAILDTVIILLAVYLRSFALNRFIFWIWCSKVLLRCLSALDFLTLLGPASGSKDHNYETEYRFSMQRQSSLPSLPSAEHCSSPKSWTYQTQRHGVIFGLSKGCTDNCMNGGSAHIIELNLKPETIVFLLQGVSIIMMLRDIKGFPWTLTSRYRRRNKRNWTEKSIFTRRVDHKIESDAVGL